MRRAEATRKHRRFLAIAASLVAAIVALLVFAAPAVDQAFRDRGRPTPPMTRSLADAGRFIAERPSRFGLLAAACFGVAWSAFSVFDRARNR